MVVDFELAPGMSYSHSTGISVSSLLLSWIYCTDLFSGLDVNIFALLLMIRFAVQCLTGEGVRSVASGCAANVIGHL